MKGIDISQHNGKINFDKVKKNVDFIILRLGWIGNKENHTLDVRFNEYYNECKKLGIPIGIYVYCYANNEKAAESGAKWTLEKLKGHEIQLPVYIDMEDGSIRHLGKNKLTNISIAFNNIIEKEYRPGVYANLDWFKNCLHKDILGLKYSLWIAHYGLLNKNKYKGLYDILQYSSSGRINGISGKVDMNEMYIDLICKSKYKAGQKVKVEIPIQIAYNNGEKSIVETEGYQFWIDNKAIKNDKIKAEGIICYADKDNYIIQINDTQFWCNEKYIK